MRCNVPRETLRSQLCGLRRRPPRSKWNNLLGAHPITRKMFHMEHSGSHTSDLHTSEVFHVKHLASLPIVC
jgi:hypothetical protein